jgi:hypothetical protein
MSLPERVSFDSLYGALVITPLFLIGLCFVVCAMSQSLRAAIAEWWFRR